MGAPRKSGHSSSTASMSGQWPGASSGSGRSWRAMIPLPSGEQDVAGRHGVIIESLRKSGADGSVPAGASGGRRPRRASRAPSRGFSRQALPTSTVRSGRRPMPRISESTGTFGGRGLLGRMTELSHRPTITRFSGSQSFRTIFAMTVSFSGSASAPPSRSSGGVSSCERCWDGLETLAKGAVHLVPYQCRCTRSSVCPSCGIKEYDCQLCRTIVQECNVLSGVSVRYV